MKYNYKEHVVTALKETEEQIRVVGPLVNFLVSRGWKVGQMIFGKTEWRIPKTPSEATKREKGQSFAGFPVDIAVFDGEIHRGDPNHLLFIVECKNAQEIISITHKRRVKRKRIAYSFGFRSPTDDVTRKPS